MNRNVPENEKGYPGVTLFGTLPAYGFFVRHAKGVVMENVRLNFDDDDRRPAVVCDDVEELAITGLKARTLPNVQPVRLVKTTLFREPSFTK
jgi:hypothetical protein